MRTNINLRLFAIIILMVIAQMSVFSQSTLLNPGFETGDLTGWGQGWGTPTVVTDAHTGTYAASNDCSGWDNGLKQVFAAKEGTTYKISFWAKVADATKGAPVSMNFYDKDNIALLTTMNGGRGYIITVASAEWKQYSQVVTTVAGTTAMSFEIFSGTSLTPQLPGIITVDDFVVTEDPTSVKTIASEGLVVYPNPITNSNLTITGIKGMVSVSIFDITGRTVYLNKLSGENLISVPRSTFKRSGLYIVNVFDGITNRTSKVVVR